MGRLLLLIVGSVAVAGAFAFHAQRESRVRRAASAATVTEQRLARQATLSGFALAERAVRDSFGTEWAEYDVPLAGGSGGRYDAVVTAAGDRMVLAVTGRFGAASHSFFASYGGGLSIPSVVMTQGQVVTVRPGEESRISGAVHRPPSVPSAGWTADDHDPVAGVSAGTDAEIEAIRLGMSGAQRNRISGSPAFTAAPVPTWIDAVVAGAPGYPGAIVHTGSVYRQIGTRQIGSPEAPAVVVAEAGARLEDYVRGYGILIVTGDLTLMDDARWEGLIVVRDVPGVETRVEFEDDAHLWGTIALHGVDETTGVAPFGAFRLRIIDTARLRWAAEPIERLGTVLSGLGAGGAAGSDRVLLPRLPES